MTSALLPASAALAAAAQAAPLRDRRLAVAVAAAVVLHLAVLGFSRSPAHADLAMPIATMVVRVLTPVPRPAHDEAAAKPGAAENTASPLLAPAAAATPRPAEPPAPPVTSSAASIRQPPSVHEGRAEATRAASSQPSTTTAALASTVPAPVPLPEARSSVANAAPAPMSPGKAGPSETTPPQPAPPPPGLPDAPAYALAANLDPGPQPLSDIEPQYPPGGQNRSGKVVLRLLISDTGHVDDVAVVRATPEGVFDEAALTAFRSARFAPGRLLGVAVKSQITIEVDFTPFNRGPAISGRGY